MKELNRHPAYQQLNDALRQLIAGGEFAARSQFLTEREIAARFGVSRATANKALSNLVSERLLEFKPGVGTFVCGSALDYNLKRLVSFTERALAAGKTPATHVLKMEQLSAEDLPPDARQALAPDGQELFCFVERLRLANGSPVILERRYFSMRHAKELTRESLSGSLYAYWSEVCGHTITGADQVIRAENLSGQDAESLRAPAGSAVLLVIATGYVDNDQPLWFERTLYRSDAYEFHTSLGAWRTSRPTIGCFSTASNE